MNATDDTTLGSVKESIETNLWMAWTYFSRGSFANGEGCLNAALDEYRAHQDAMDIPGRVQLKDRLAAIQTLRDATNSSSVEIATDPNITYLVTKLREAEERNAQLFAVAVRAHQLNTYLNSIPTVTEECDDLNGDLAAEIITADANDAISTAAYMQAKAEKGQKR